VSDADRMSYAYLQKLTLKSASPLPFNATGNRTGTSRSLTHAPAEGLSARSPLKSSTRRETRSGTRSVRPTPNGNPQNPTPVADCPPPRCSTPSLPAAVTSQPHQPFEDSTPKFSDFSSACPTPDGPSPANRTAVRGVAAIESHLRAVVRPRYPSLDAVYRAFDVDGDGLISGRDLGAALRAEGLAPVGRLELTTLMAHADANQDGYIDRREFTKWLTSSSPSNEPVVRTALGRMRTLLDARYHTMGAAFQALGAARPHCHLERSDLQRVLTGAGIHLPEDDMDALVRRFDPDGTGRITHANFIRALAP